VFRILAKSSLNVRIKNVGHVVAAMAEYASKIKISIHLRVVEV
jgi:hypothetical protein